jgi:hypothetical protein
VDAIDAHGGRDSMHEYGCGEREHVQVSCLVQYQKPSNSHSVNNAKLVPDQKISG